MKGCIKHHKRTALALGMLLVLLPSAAFAQVKLSVAADSDNVKAGDTVEIIVKVSGKNMSIAEGTFIYDPAVLTYVKSTGGASDGFLNMVSAEKGGADTLAARMTFTAAGAGSSDIQVSIERILGYDGKEQGRTEASVSLTVTAPAPTPGPTPLNYAAEGVLAKNVKGTEESMYIWRSLENVTLPSRYTQIALTYHGETVAAVEVTGSDAPTLLYLSNAAGDRGSYYIFNEATDMLVPYQTVSSVSKSYILLEPDGRAALPDGFTETTLTIDEKEITAWKAQDDQGDLYLLYARNPDGEVGYFVYNPEDESLQRFAVMPARPAQPMLPPELKPTPVVQAVPTLAPAEPAAPALEEADKITVNSTLFYAVCGTAALLFIILASFVVTRLVEDARCKRKAAQRKAERERAKEREIGL